MTLKHIAQARQDTHKDRTREVTVLFCGIAAMKVSRATFEKKLYEFLDLKGPTWYPFSLFVIPDSRGAVLHKVVIQMLPAYYCTVRY